MNKIDMSWGSPAFLVPYWETHGIKVARQIDRDMTYNFGSRESLKQIIRDIHNQEQNAETDGKHIVVAAGATQIILGLLHVLKKETGAGAAWANPPHFSRFPHLAEFAGLEWAKKKNSLIITTVPNNPDGSQIVHKNTAILDLTYNWPQYLAKVKNFDHPAMVFSLSKATGHASTRIGWAILEDEMTARGLEQYIEYSTSGLSIDSQLTAEAVLSSQLNADYTVFDDGKKTLGGRMSLLDEIEKRLPFKIIKMAGMFLWAEGDCPKEIIGLDGRTLRGPSGTFRLNIGCSSESFISFHNLFAKKKLSMDSIV